MKLSLSLQSRRHDKENKTLVNLILYTEIDIISEVMPKTLLSLVAEVGGYLGLTLGVSLLDLKTFFSFLWMIAKKKQDEWSTVVLVK